MIQGNRSYSILDGINPIAWYKFDDGTPATFNDYSGNYFNLTNNGATYTSTAGTFAKGLGAIVLMEVLLNMFQDR